jgi:hypothetical protein
MTSQPPHPAALSVTRRCLHGVAELVLAGPQYRRTGEIQLRVSPGGFATVFEPALRVDRAELVVGARRLALAGTTFAELGAAAGVEAGAPAGLYHDGSGVDLSEVVSVDETAAGYLADWFALGEQALRRLAPDATPVLWPEHFDLAISIGEVNYGVSPGDAAVPEPYAYVGPWQPHAGEFWNMSFGAARTRPELPDLDALLAFLAEGRERAGADR